MTSSSSYEVNPQRKEVAVDVPNDEKKCTFQQVKYQYLAICCGTFKAAEIQIKYYSFCVP